MLQRFLYTPEGSVRAPRMIGLLVATIVFALFGSFLLNVTPELGGKECVQTMRVVF